MKGVPLASVQPSFCSSSTSRFDGEQTVEARQIADRLDGVGDRGAWPPACFLNLPQDGNEGRSDGSLVEHGKILLPLVRACKQRPSFPLSTRPKGMFLVTMKDEFPAQYALAFPGFATGLRPSSLQPLRRTGLTPDVLWDQGAILVRRSHTIGDELMNPTKTKLRQRITVPSELMDVLRWHVNTQLVTAEQKASGLLFPAENGGLRSVSFLKKAFATLGTLVGLNKRVTPRGMRRTFNDLARAVNVEAIITKSISGHQTDGMGEHYSTVTPDEQRRSIGSVVPLFGPRKSGERSGEGAPSGTNIQNSPRLSHGASGGGDSAKAIANDQVKSRHGAVVPTFPARDRANALPRALLVHAPQTVPYDWLQQSRSSRASAKPLRETFR